MLNPINLKCEYRQNPLGVDVLQPRLSWQFDATERGQAQSAYQILAADTPDELAAGRGNLWDSGRVESNQSIHIVYTGTPLRSEQRCWWQARVWDKEGRPSAYSQPAWWQTGLLNAAEWQGQWVSFDTGPAIEPNMPPAPYLRRAFSLDKPVRRATAYVTAKGLYRLRLNGRPVGQAALAPDWTDYRQRVFYDTYDVTNLLGQGDNVIGAILGDGWHSGYLGWIDGPRGHYGQIPWLLLQLNIEYADGSQTAVVTDNAWQGSAGPIIFSDFYMGETYDARRNMPGWDTVNFNAAAWQPAQVEPIGPVKLTAQSAEPVRVVGKLAPQTVTQPQPGVWVFDMGQNMVGWVRLRVKGAAGDRLRLRFAEILNPDGTVYTNNLRLAKATDTYILKGGRAEAWEPQFTFHGFRYVELTGFPGEPTRQAITGCVAQSDLAMSGQFECSSPLVNQVWRNQVWGQRGNFLSVPTDCPQRDERLGWLGDILAFGPTACFNMDSAAFLSRWLVNVEDAQSPEGGFPDIAPRVVNLADGAPAWGDAGVVIPWVLYQAYNDTRVIERHYAAMSRWMSYVLEANPNFLRAQRLHNNYGDWVSFNADTPRDVLATAFWADSARLMARMAQAIGQADDAKMYQQLFENIRAAFINAYVSADGRVQGDTQTCYALALQMDLLPADLRPAAARRLVENIKERGWHLSTGFVGTPQLLPALSNAGYTDVAYRLLLNDTLPSWGHMVKMGATTIWERWNSLTEETVFDPATSGYAHPEMGTLAHMNSFNHYAFGSVGEWLYRVVGGINSDPLAPGFGHIVIRPRPGGGLTRAKAVYDSIRGRIISNWYIRGRAFRLKVTIPANVTATVYVPASQPGVVTPSEGAQFLWQTDGAAVFAVESGQYEFVAVV